MFMPERRCNLTHHLEWAVLFDVDGTMVDNARYHEQAWIELGNRYDVPITRAVYRTRLHSRANSQIVSALFPDQSTPEFVHRIAAEKEALYRELYRPVVAEIDGLPQLLQALADEPGVSCAAVSNSPRPNVDMILSALNLRDFFAVVLSCDDVSVGKPDPCLFLTAAQRLAVPVAQCVIIEDSISGFRAAEAAGAPYVVITRGADPDELRHATAAKAFHQDFTSVTVHGLRRLVASSA
ncbi:MAG: hypothetical protein A2W31_08550 [Planctomycetes bacterium RBG_16_64_10]|nr:MAG: hypothetical protein A2W31_08550 [Planctomycetes bacterium RBG_16_64_10]